MAMESTLQGGKAAKRKYDSVANETTLHIDYSTFRDHAQCMRHLVNNTMLSDVTFLVGSTKTKIHAHKIFLVAQSEPFHAMFCKGFKEERVAEIHIPNISADVFLQLINFLYTGNLRLAKDDMEFCVNLLLAANQYAIEGLKILCRKHIQATMSSDNVVTILECACQLNSPNLYEMAFVHCETHFSEVIQTESFLRLAPQNLIKFVPSEKIEVNETTLFESVLKWGINQFYKQVGIAKLRVSKKQKSLHTDIRQWSEEDKERLRSILKDIFVHIRFPLMSSDELWDCVAPYEEVVGKTLLDEAFRYIALKHRKLPCFEGVRFKPRASSPQSQIHLIKM